MSKEKLITGDRKNVNDDWTVIHQSRENLEADIAEILLSYSVPQDCIDHIHGYIKEQSKC